MRQIFVLFVLISASARAQFPSEYGCFAYQPGDVEITEILELANSQVAAGTGFLEACSEKVRPIILFPEVEAKEVRVYSLFWPTDKAIGTYRYCKRENVRAGKIPLPRAKSNRT